MADDLSEKSFSVRLFENVGLSLGLIRTQNYGDAVNYSYILVACVASFQRERHLKSWQWGRLGGLDKPSLWQGVPGFAPLVRMPATVGGRFVCDWKSSTTGLFISDIICLTNDIYFQ